MSWECAIGCLGSWKYQPSEPVTATLPIQLLLGAAVQKPAGSMSLSSMPERSGMAPTPRLLMIELYFSIPVSTKNMCPMMSKPTLFSTKL